MAKASLIPFDTRKKIAEAVEVENAKKACDRKTYDEIAEDFGECCGRTVGYIAEEFGVMRNGKQEPRGPYGPRNKPTAKHKNYRRNPVTPAPQSASTAKDTKAKSSKTTTVPTAVPAKASTTPTKRGRGRPTDKERLEYLGSKSVVESAELIARKTVKINRLMADIKTLTKNLTK